MTDTERKLAEGLLEIGAVLLRPDEPFTWASGWKSPIYCDNRRILSSPELREEVAGELAFLALTACPGADVVAGVATGAIAHGVLVAQKLGKPFVYVRPTPKDHGTRSQIEGVLPAGSKVVVIEDLVSTGKSSLMAVRALRDAGAEVLGMVAIFTYAFPEAEAAFAGEGVRLVTISNYPALVRAAIDGGRLSPETEKTLGEWRENPSVWKQE